MSSSKIVPFISKPNAKITDEIVEIGNDKSGKVKIKKLGCLTLNESRAIDELLDKLIQNSDKKPVSTSNQLKLGVVTLAFQTRIIFTDTNEKGEIVESIGSPAWNLADTEANFDSCSDLYEEIYDFFYLKERSRWKDSNYLLKIEGDDAELVAKKHAEDNGLATAGDGTAWYIFRSEEDISESYIRSSEPTGSTGRRGRGK